jgi:hypothetical protein
MFPAVPDMSMAATAARNPRLLSLESDTKLALTNGPVLSQTVAGSSYPLKVLTKKEKKKNNKIKGEHRSMKKNK